MTDKTAQTNLFEKAAECAKVDETTENDDTVKSNTPLSVNRLIKLFWTTHPKQMKLATSINVYFSSEKSLERISTFDKKEYVYLRPIFITIENCLAKDATQRCFTLPADEVNQFHEHGIRVSTNYKRKLIPTSPINILQISKEEQVFSDKFGNGIHYHESRIIQKDKAQSKLIETLIELDKQDTDQFDP